MIHLNGDAREWHDGMTVRELFGRDEQELHLLLVIIDDALVPRTEYESRLIPDGAHVKLVRLATGG